MEMKKHNSTIRGSISLLLVCGALFVHGRAMALGSWAPVTATAPGGAQIGLMLLLADGTVMAQGYGGSNWFRLHPDAHGSYVNGYWTTMASMSYTRTYCSSQVLRDGRVFVAGGEYGTGQATAEVYDAVADQWTLAPVPLSLINPSLKSPALKTGNQAFLDSGSEILDNGDVLVAPVGPNVQGGTLIYHPFSNTWQAGPLTSSVYQDEASWVKLPDDSILTIDPGAASTERYIPALNAWIADRSVPISLYDGVQEIGAAFLLPNGKAFFLGATGNTALYTPSGDTNLGTWAIGPTIPGGRVAADAPAAMMVNGKILCAVTSASNHNPIYFYEYDPVANSFSASVPSPTGGFADTNTISDASIMLDLPDGKVLYSDATSQVYVYTPDGVPLPAGKPAIGTITSLGNGSFHLVGTGLNGISEGASFGDDNQMNSNYPLVRAADGSGNVYYLPTYNWSGTGVSTGSKAVSTEFFAFPSLSPGFAYSLVAVANGIASDPVTFYGPVWVDLNGGIPIQIGSYDLPYHTLGQGVSAVPSTGTINFKTAGHTLETMTISKPMTIVAIGGPVTIGQ